MGTRRGTHPPSHPDTFHRHICRGGNGGNDIHFLDAPGRHEYPIGRVDPPDRLLSVFLKGVAIFTNLLLHSLKWDRTSTRLLRVSFYPELAKTSIAFFHYNIKRKNAKAICIPSINAWALDLKGVSVSSQIW